MDLSQLSLLNDKALNIPSLSSCYEMLILITQRNAVDNFQVKKNMQLEKLVISNLGRELSKLAALLRTLIIKEMIPMYVYKMYLFLFELLYHCFSSTASFNLKVNKTKVITTANRKKVKFLITNENSK